MQTVAFVSLAAAFLSMAASTAEGCSGDSLASYRVTFHAEWSEEQFPKQYPKWRPPAQWSVVIGRTHDPGYHLWRLGDVVSKGVKLFLQQGKMDVLHGEAQGEKGILDDFYLPPLPIGVGSTEAQFLASSNHSRLSLMVKLVPSPDWFVGVDSLDLCGAGHWLDEINVEASPLDAGVENGFTFTSPKWETESPSPVTRITAHFPNHRANSFYYPHLKKLPRIGYFHFSKIQAYQKMAERKDAAAIISNTQVDKELNEPKESADELLKKLEEVSPNSYINLQAERAENADTATPFPRNTKISTITELSDDAAVNSINDFPVSKPVKKLEKEKRKKLRKKSRSGSRHCKVSEWSEWSPCSQTCGSGEKLRTRQVIQPARRRGRPCPVLQQSRFCQESYSCIKSVNGLPDGYFQW